MNASGVGWSEWAYEPGRQQWYRARFDAESGWVYDYRRQPPPEQSVTSVLM
jgi:hypothetical protein